MNNLVQRLLTGLLLAPIVMGLIYYSQYGLLAMAGLASLICLWEFFALAGIGKRIQTFFVMGAGALTWLALLEPVKPYLPTVLLLLVIPIIGLLTLFDKKTKQPLYLMGVYVLGLLYCFMPIVLLYLMSDMGMGGREYDFWIPIGVLFLNWALDTGAYFAGKFLGKHPLFPRISPKKTWEGAVGGTILCFAFAFLGYAYADISPANWLVIAAIISVSSQLGDLTESMFKRSVAVKDSGSILPGHGGFLDRFDGLFFSAPLVYVYLTLIS